MTRDIFRDRERAEEDAYFRQQDAKLIAKLRQKAQLSEIAHALAEKLQVARCVHVVEEPTEALWQQADIFALASYFEGYGVTKDIPGGVIWTRKAAEQGFAPAEE